MKRAGEPDGRVTRPGASLSNVASNGGLPLTARTRIVRELSADLRALTDQLVAKGVAPEEASRRAAEVVVPAGPALQELEDLARPLYRRLVAHVHPRRIHAAERGALGVATLLLLAVEGTALLGAGVLADPSPWLWPVLAAGTATLVAVLAKAFQLWIKGAHEDPRRGIAAVAVLSGLTLALGCSGALLGLLELAATVEAAPESATRLTLAWLVRDAALLSTAIILSVTGGLGWLALNGWTTWAEQTYTEALALTSISSQESS